MRIIFCLMLAWAFLCSWVLFGHGEEKPKCESPAYVMKQNEPIQKILNIAAPGQINDKEHVLAVVKTLKEEIEEHEDIDINENWTNVLYYHINEDNTIIYYIFKDGCLSDVKGEMEAKDWFEILNMSKGKQA